MFKSEFPLLVNHPHTIYLDNAATTQKPAMVIDGVDEFIRNEYANIHRGLYKLSENSETHYYNSKLLVAELLNAEAREIIYTANSTDAFNLLAQSLAHSGFLGEGDVVLLGIRDHHANILPWMALSKHFGFEVRFFGMNEKFEIDFDDFAEKYTQDVKVVSCGQVSNVTGSICDVKHIASLLREDTFFIVDASQSVPNMHVDMQDIGCDALIFTGHKVMAYTGIGVLALKHHWIKNLNPLSVGGGTIRDVATNGFQLKTNNEKFEAGTPNIIGAVSLEYALKFIQSLGDDKTLYAGIQAIARQEEQLTKYALEKFKKFENTVRVFGPKESSQRVPLFSFVIKDKENFNQVGEFFAEKDICIRCGGHCVYPLHKYLGIGGTCRMSAYFYNDRADLDKFFARLEALIAK